MIPLIRRIVAVLALAIMLSGPIFAIASVDLVHNMEAV
jgi:hypothetical protein